MIPIVARILRMHDLPVITLGIRRNAAEMGRGLIPESPTRSRLVPKATGLLTRGGLLIRESESFWPKILGCEGNLLGCLRTLFGLSRNREFSASGQIDVNHCRKAG